MDETYLKIGGRQRYLFRAIDEHGQIIGVYLSDRRDAAAAHACLVGAIGASGVTPTCVTTGYPPGEAKCYPPALWATRPAAQHRCSKYLNNGLERDHQHLKGCVRPMRRFKACESASTFCQGHRLIRNRGRVHSSLTEKVAPRMRLVRAWTALTALL